VTEESGDRPGGGRAAAVSLAAVAAALALKAAAVAWALDRGFEIGDEGYLLLNLNHPGNAPETFPVYDLLTLFGTGPRFGVLDARLLRVAVEGLASALLLAGVAAWARRRILPAGPFPWRAFLGLSLLGAFLTIGTRSLGYNDLTNLCVYGATGGLLAVLAIPPDRSGERRRLLLGLGIGLATGLQLGVKFTSGILLGAMAVATTLLLASGLPAAARLRLLAVQAAGVLAAVALYALASGGFAELAAGYALAPTFSELGGYDPLALLGRLVLGELLTALDLVLAAAVLVLVLRWRARSPGLPADGRIARALGVAALLLVPLAAIVRPFFVPPVLLYLSVLLLLLGALLVSLETGRLPSTAIPAIGRGRRELAPLLLLAAAPLVAMAGTNVPPTMRLPTHALPWFVAVAVLSCDLRARRRLVRVQAVAAIVLALVTSALVFRHQLAAPYGLPRPIAGQRHAVEGLDVRVDAPTRDFLEALSARMQAEGFRPGDPIFALDYMPGLVFYLGGVSPGWNFHRFDKPELNCFNIDRARYPGRPFLLLGRPIPEAQRRCLRSLDLEDGYRLAAQIAFPYRDVYESFDAPTFTHLYVYAPRTRAEAPHDAPEEAPAGR